MKRLFYNFICRWFHSFAYRSDTNEDEGKGHQHHKEESKHNK
jgi:hypothetical protein